MEDLMSRHYWWCLVDILLELGWHWITLARCKNRVSFSLYKSIWEDSDVIEGTLQPFQSNNYTVNPQRD